MWNYKMQWQQYKKKEKIKWNQQKLLMKCLQKAFQEIFIIIYEALFYTFIHTDYCTTLKFI